jgi:hypothetical protein
MIVMWNLPPPPGFRGLDPHKPVTVYIRHLPHWSLWQEESFDRIIRDEEHLFRAIEYVGSNPMRAGLSHDMCSLWIRPEWKDLGWGFKGQ